MQVVQSPPLPFLRRATIQCPLPLQHQSKAPTAPTRSCPRFRLNAHRQTSSAAEATMGLWLPMQLTQPGPLSVEPIFSRQILPILSPVLEFAAATIHPSAASGDDASQEGRHVRTAAIFVVLPKTHDFWLSRILNGHTRSRSFEGKGCGERSWQSEGERGSSLEGGEVRKRLKNPT